MHSANVNGRASIWLLEKSNSISSIRISKSSSSSGSSNIPNDFNEVAVPISSGMTFNRFEPNSSLSSLGHVVNTDVGISSIGLFVKLREQRLEHSVDHEY